MFKGTALILPVFLIALVAAHMTAQAQVSQTTQNFIRNAAVGGLFEIQSSQLALDKSQNPQIRQFAQRMIDDHTRIDDQLKAVAPANADTPTTLDEEHQKLMDQLQNATGADFDSLYAKIQQKAHMQTINLFRRYASSGDNTALKDLADKTLSVLQEHLQMAKQLKG